MPHSFGYRARTRDMFSRPFRTKGMIKLSTYMTTYKRGDYVDIKCNPAQHKGMPHKGFHGRTGIVYNVTKRAVGVKVNKYVVAGGKILEKRINVRVEHVIPSKCRLGHIERVKKNDEIKKAVKAGKMEKQNLKRTPVMPRQAYTVKLSEPETIQPIPYSNML
eukprot:CAMPEP_0172595174 /NCGR_PEP_ID=MMETSP1068-20121228/14752_1 /TAXON_ID=35684 /ORGANISM="Pseudopedinella elastica, Strain CCMP716" /LENGTH=161 /DNA_ID=CAMNT_0013393607 /DNA_START=126 /DNA_END=611 /DNA_ORIENTATION=+